MDFHLDTLLKLPKLTVLTCSQQLDCIFHKITIAQSQDKSPGVSGAYIKKNYHHPSGRANAASQSWLYHLTASGQTSCYSLAK
jgi:hypothetical protein